MRSQPTESDDTAEDLRICSVLRQDIVSARSELRCNDLTSGSARQEQHDSRGRMAGPQRLDTPQVARDAKDYDIDRLSHVRVGHGGEVVDCLDRQTREFQVMREAGPD